MPSEQMSWVAEAMATTQSSAMMAPKYAGRLSASPISTNNAPITNSIDTTKNFFVLNMSRKPAQSGLSDQTMPTAPVAMVISVSEWPRSLNRVPVTQITIEKGIPIAMKFVITQSVG